MNIILMLFMAFAPYRLPSPTLGVSCGSECLATEVITLTGDYWKAKSRVGISISKDYKSYDLTSVIADDNGTWRLDIYDNPTGVYKITVFSKNVPSVTAGFEVQ